MNWDAVAAISAALGAVGVIATVVYVAFQIRQNTMSIQGATEQSLMTAELSLYTLLAQHASVYRRGRASESALGPDEEELFENLILAMMSQLYGAFVQYQRKLVPESVWAAYLNDWATYSQEPGVQRVWSSYRKSYPKEFRRILESSGDPVNS